MPPKYHAWRLFPPFRGTFPIGISNFVVGNFKDRAASGFCTLKDDESFILVFGNDNDDDGDFFNIRRLTNRSTINDNINPPAPATPPLSNKSENGTLLEFVPTAAMPEVSSKLLAVTVTECVVYTLCVAAVIDNNDNVEVGLAPSERVAVGVCVIERRDIDVCEGLEPKDNVGKSVPLDVALTISEFVFEEDAPTVNKDVGVCNVDNEVPTNPLGGVFDGLDVIEGDDPFDNDDVGEAVTVIRLVAVLEYEDVRDELEVTVLEDDVVADGVREEEDVIDIVTLSVLLRDIGALGLLLILAPRERLDVGLCVDD
jgi:hypothetical protein